MSTSLARPKFFISATSGALEQFRTGVADHLGRCGFAKDDVAVQRPYPTRMRDGRRIQEAIDAADVVICLIGYDYGQPLPEEDLPPDVPNGYSWTQWEWWHAKNIARKDNKRLWVFFYMNSPEEAGQDERQRKFRDDVKRSSPASFTSPFYYEFKDLYTLQDFIDRLVKANLADDYWMATRAEYREASISEWLVHFPRSHFGNEDERAELVACVPWMYAKVVSRGPYRPPFIATQAFRILNIGSAEAQLQYLVPAAFLPGRDSEEEARISQGANWQPLRRVDLVRMLRDPAHASNLEPSPVELPHPLRLFLITGGGVGKSTNIRWLEAALNGHGSRLALLIEAAVLAKEPALEGILWTLTEAIVRRTNDGPLEKDSWAHRVIKDRLRKDLEDGLLTILVDGLDHVAPKKTARFVLETERGLWDKSAIVMAGRPHALQDWAEGSSRADAVDASRWRFLQPDEFDEQEGMAYLDVPGKKPRYELVEASLGGLAHVPRVLEYVRELTEAQIEGCRTSADIYLLAIEKLIARTITEGGKRTRMDPELATKLLAALAFQTRCPTEDESHLLDPSTCFDLDEDVKSSLDERMRDLGYDGDLNGDLERLGRFATIIGNGIVNAAATEAGSPKRMDWSNRTAQEFLAAYWLARFASKFDADRMRLHVFRPEDRRSDDFYEFNVFLAEMPRAGRSSVKWVEAARAWYAFDGQRTRPSEMIYRSWRTMHAIAGRALDDWWNTSYEDLVAGKRTRPPDSSHTNAEAQKSARAILDGYQGAFQAILDEQGTPDEEAARELVDSQSWCAVPGSDDPSFLSRSPGGFEMGSTSGQGFPAKTAAYWNQVLGDVQTGAKTAEAAARDCTDAHWFTGAAGARLMARDIAWLAKAFEPLEKGPRKRDPYAVAYLEAYAKIEHKWRRKDETPAENPQSVNGFVLQRYPVLHSWYRLFSPAHAQTVASYLGAKQTGKMAIAHPPENHPVIYVSWYDAWAFCQWVRWIDEGSGTGYGLRLPHEVEWEYAARWSKRPDGSACPVPIDHPYWWGTTFYTNSEGVKEPISTDVAHAVGAPGATRAPAEASPNGLGLYDMLGNVWEWMANIYDTSEQKTVEQRATVRYSRKFPEGVAPANPQRAMRGGLWYYLDLLATVSNRYRLTAEDRDYKIGFRVVREERPEVARAGCRRPSASATPR